MIQFFICVLGALRGSLSGNHSVTGERSLGVLECWNNGFKRMSSLASMWCEGTIKIKRFYSYPIIPLPHYSTAANSI